MNNLLCDDSLELGRKLFAGACEFVWAAKESGGLPPPGPPEFAFAGRSNVGKSSLLNALTNRAKLARASQTPGRTRELNFFALGIRPPAEDLRLVDLPGYGYAAAGKEKSAAWMRLMGDYLRGRATLARVFLLIDGRYGLKQTDHQMMDVLDRAAVPYQVVLTKNDLVTRAAEEPQIAAVEEALARRPAAFPAVLSTSACTGEGVAELRAAVARLLYERRG